MIILREGNIGENVRMLQEFLQLDADGVFGKATRDAVCSYQEERGLVIDGVVGPMMMSTMKVKWVKNEVSTDLSETIHAYKPKNLITEGDLQYRIYNLGQGQYKDDIVCKPEYIFLHHTGGWDNPFDTIDDWNNDSRGRIGTEWIIGGNSIYGKDKHSGVVVKAIPDGNYAWHLGYVADRNMHIQSTAIELCNFGELTQKDLDIITYAGQIVAPTEIVKLDNSYKGFDFFHKYSDSQLEATKNTLLFIANRDNIELRDGLISLIGKMGPKAFEYDLKHSKGLTKGLLTHGMVRKDKRDIVPQQNMIDMLLSL